MFANRFNLLRFYERVREQGPVREHILNFNHRLGGGRLVVSKIIIIFISLELGMFTMHELSTFNFIRRALTLELSILQF